MKTTFDLPDALIRKAKSLAAEQGRPLRDFVAEAITAKLELPTAMVIGGKRVPVGRREGRRETWEEYRSKFVLQSDGTYRNMDAIDDESFYRTLEEIRRRPFERRDPFADQK